MMTETYRAILRLYPARYREILGPEMAQTFAQARESCSTDVRFAAREFAGLLKGLFTEWFSKWTNASGYLNSGNLAIDASSLPTDIGMIETQLRRSIACMEFAIANHDFPKARFYSYTERALRSKLNRIVAAYEGS